MGGQLVQLITDEELDVAPSAPELADLVAQLLGDGDNELRASDADLAAAIFGFADGAAAVAGGDALFAESVALADVVTEDTLAGETVKLTQDVDNGRKIVTDLDALFGEPPPPSAAPPISSGERGDGGGDRHRIDRSVTL